MSDKCQFAIFQRKFFWRKLKLRLLDKLENILGQFLADLCQDFFTNL